MEGWYYCDVWVNYYHDRILLDSGSMVTLVHPRVMERVGPIPRSLKVVCIHGETNENAPWCLST